MKEIKTTLEFEGKNYDVITKEFPSCGIATRIFVCGETDEETVSITRKELIAKMAKVFADWAKERKTDSALIVSVVVGADIANRLCDSIFGKKGE